MNRQRLPARRPTPAGVQRVQGVAQQDRANRQTTRERAIRQTPDGILRQQVKQDRQHHENHQTELNGLALDEDQNQIERNEKIENQVHRHADGNATRGQPADQLFVGRHGIAIQDGINHAGQRMHGQTDDSTAIHARSRPWLCRH